MKVVEKVRACALPVVTGVMVAVPALSAYAAGEGTGTEIDLATITTDAVNSLKGDMLIVIGATTGVAVALIGITVGVSYLLKKLKGLRSQAG
ncbi:hypothetical protein AALB39_02065 [Lachnospiraceae bacterium 54-53]